MPKINPYDSALKDYANVISSLVGIDEELALKVIKALEVAMLHELYEKGCDNEENGTIRTDWVSIYVPLLGKFWLYPINRDNKSDDNNDGYTFKSTITLDKRILRKMKETYYNHYDFMKDEISDKFQEIFPEEFRSLI